ncbi:hypothetical protein OPT61_g10367 [Boeremia exigua]|uniref:Uncharacterized protein n=1 Tax=Boeremia exigua TaxID=749465 RepID=A0ACC2HQK1_9PLEO|nr:hypothetical protein OPT61_g10367 [Boeremia exigua]
MCARRPPSSTADYGTRTISAARHSRRASHDVDAVIRRRMRPASRCGCSLMRRVAGLGGGDTRHGGSVRRFGTTIRHDDSARRLGTCSQACESALAWVGLRPAYGLRDAGPTRPFTSTSASAAGRTAGGSGGSSPRSCSSRSFQSRASAASAAAG